MMDVGGRTGRVEHNNQTSLGRLAEELSPRLRSEGANR